MLIFLYFYFYFEFMTFTWNRVFYTVVLLLLLIVSKRCEYFFHRWTFICLFQDNKGVMYPWCLHPPITISVGNSQLFFCYNTEDNGIFAQFRELIQKSLQISTLSLPQPFSMLLWLWKWPGSLASPWPSASSTSTPLRFTPLYSGTSAWECAPLLHALAASQLLMSSI